MELWITIKKVVFTEMGLYHVMGAVAVSQLTTVRVLWFLSGKKQGFPSSMIDMLTANKP